MAVYERNGIYHYEFEYRGKRFRNTCETTNKNTALKVEAKARTEAMSGKLDLLKKKDVPTLEEYRDDFEDELRLKFNAEEKARTLDFYLTTVRKIIEHHPKLARKSLDAITEQDLHAFTSFCSLERGLSNGTINRRLATLRKWLRFAKKMRVIDRVPEFDMLEEAPPRDFVLTDKFEGDYLKVCPKHLYDFSVLAIESGMRFSENLRLKWEDVHFEAKGVGTRGHIHCRGTKSKNSKRNIPMSARMLEHLLKLWAEPDRGEYVLHSVRSIAKPASKDTLEDAFQRVREAHKLPVEFVPHAFRHTMLTRLGEAGAGAFTIMEVAGHASVTMSQRYVHPTAGMREGAFDMLDQFRAKSPHKSPHRSPAVKRPPTSVPTKVPTKSSAPRMTGSK